MTDAAKGKTMTYWSWFFLIWITICTVSAIAALVAALVQP